MSENSNKRQKIIRKTIEAADGLSLGISMVVAILIGIGVGYLLKKFTPYPWLFWLGVFWGVAAAIPVSYTHLTLPTIHLVLITVVTVHYIYQL
ncbi:AtpZ/AtpI family protein, partial [Campylobacter coli]|uniref:AtpZ/AtpI family protein n=1 Tax=Campylobacter coli TaxID=195 RepID=UPI00382AEA05